MLPASTAWWGCALPHTRADCELCLQTAQLPATAFRPLLPHQGYQDVQLGWLPGARASPQLMSLLSLQPAHSLLCAGFVTQATWARGLANWCEQYYLFSDLWEWRSDGCEKSLPPFLPPSQACGEVLTGLVSCHLCLGYPAIACTARASARLMALGQLASMVRTAVKYLLSACGATAPGM